MTSKRTDDKIDLLTSRLQDHLLKREMVLGTALLDHQRPIFDAPERHIVLAKGRRWGGTRGAMVKAITLAWRHNLSGLWVDTAYGNIMEYVTRYAKPALRTLPRTVWRWNQQTQRLSFTSGGFIKFGSADRPDLLEGFGYDFFILNEAGHILKNESLYYETLLPMGAEGTQVRWYIIGTPKPGAFLFHQFYLQGVEGPDRDPSWRSFMRPSMDNPLLNPAELDVWKRVMPEKVFRREVLGEFILEGGEFFTTLEGLAFPPVEALAVPGATYTLGVDLAKAQDWTVVWVGRLLGGNTIDPMQQRRGVVCYRWQKLPWPDTIQRIKEIASDYGLPSLHLDATGLGDPIVDELRSAGLRVEGHILNPKARQELLHTLAADIEQHRLSIYPHAETLAELRAFGSTINPVTHNMVLRAPSGKHDDCVIALALMNYGLGRPGGGIAMMSRPSLIEDFPSLLN